MPFSPSSYESMKNSLIEASRRDPYTHRNRISVGGKPTSSIDDSKLNRLEKILEKQQNEIEFLRAKLDEVSVSSACATPVYPPYHQPCCDSPSAYMGGPGGVFRSQHHHHQAVPFGYSRAYRVEAECGFRPASAAAFMRSERRHFFNDEIEKVPPETDCWGPPRNKEPIPFRPQSALDRWADNEHDFSYTETSRNPFEGSSSRCFPDTETLFENKTMEDNRYPINRVQREENGFERRMGVGRGNFRGSGFRTKRQGAGRGQSSLTVGQQARDSLTVLKNGFPRSSSPNEPYSGDSSDTSTSKQSSTFKLPRPGKIINNTLVPNLPPRKMKGFVDESFMSQQEDNGSISEKSKIEPRPASSILKIPDIVDESFDSSNSNSNPKSVTFKMDPEITAALNRDKSSSYPGEETPSPTSSASCESISSLIPADFTVPDLRGQVVHIVTPDEFYIVIHESEELSEALQTYAANRKTRRIHHPSKLREGDLCIAKYKDGLWYRATVSYPGKNPEVLLVDYGNMFTVQDPVEDNLRAWDNRFLRYQVQGEVAQLANVAPPGRLTEWPFTSIEEFKRLTANRVMYVEVVDANSTPPVIRLIDESDGVDISDTLTELAFAKMSK